MERIEQIGLYFLLKKRKSPPMKIFRIALIAATAFALGHTAAARALKGSTAPPAQSANQQAAPQQPWMNPSLDPDIRADLMIHEMTLDEKIQMVHGTGLGPAPSRRNPIPPRSNLAEPAFPGRYRGLALPESTLPIPPLACAWLPYRVATPRCCLPPSALASVWNPEAGVPLRLGHRPRTRAQRLQHVHRRRRQPHPRAAQRAQL